MAPTGGLGVGGMNSLALGFSTNSFAFGFSLDLVTILAANEEKNNNGKKYDSLTVFFSSLLVLIGQQTSNNASFTLLKGFIHSIIEVYQCH